MRATAIISDKDNAEIKKKQIRSKTKKKQNYWGNARKIK